jgi:hypothetical protein
MLTARKHNSHVNCADKIVTRNSDTVLAMLRTSVHRDSLLSIHQYNPHEDISVTVISYMSLYTVSEKKNGGVLEGPISKYTKGIAEC